MSSGWARPGFDFAYCGGIANFGGTASGPVTCVLTFDPSLSVLNTTPANGTVSGNTITWTGPPVGGNSYTYYSAILHVPATAVIGASLTASFNVQQDSIEYTLANNSWSITHTIVGSFDPNDKSVTPSDFYVLGTDSMLDYTIRFQNTGTFMATHVVLRDTLPLEVDPTSFRPGAASHPYTYSLTANGILEVRFENINLLDSNANEALSHGLFNFRIRPNMPLLPGTTITNRADIFFDFNAPIRTNDAAVVVTDETRIVPVTKPAPLAVYPVPVKNTLNAVLPEGFMPMNAYAIAIDGQRLPLPGTRAVALRAEWNVERLAAGPYVLVLTDRSGQRLSARFVKE